MASTGPNYASSCVDGSGGVFSWTNPGNAAASDGSYATSFSNNDQTTNYLTWTGFGFSIPSGATIDGIVLEVGRLAQTTQVSDAGVYLVKGGSRVGVNRFNGVGIGGTLAIATYGSSSDLWGATWTDSDVNASNFGAAWSAVNSSLANRTVSVDYARITVYYTTGSGATASASALVGSGTLPAVSVAYGRAVAASALAGSGALPSATASVARTRAVNPLAGSATLPAPALHGDASSAASPFVGAGTLPAHAAGVSRTIAVASLSGSAACPAPIARVARTISASPLAGAGTLPAAVAGASRAVAAGPLAGSGTIRPAEILSDASRPVSAIAGAGVLPAAGASVARAVAVAALTGVGTLSGGAASGTANRPASTLAAPGSLPGVATQGSRTLAASPLVGAGTLPSAATSGDGLAAASPLTGAGGLPGVGSYSSRTIVVSPLAGSGTLPAAAARGATVKAASALAGSGGVGAAAGRGDCVAAAGPLAGASGLGLAHRAGAVNKAVAALAAPGTIPTPTPRVSRTRAVSALAGAGTLPAHRGIVGRSVAVAPLAGGAALVPIFPGNNGIVGASPLAGSGTLPAATPPAPGSILVRPLTASWISGRDTFTGVAGTDIRLHTSDVGGTWARHPAYPAGAAALTNAGRLRASASTTAVWLSSGPPSNPDYDVTFDAKVVTLPAKLWIEVAAVGRALATDDYYMLRLIWSDGLWAWQLCRVAAGMVINIAASYTPPGQPLQYASTATLRMRQDEISGLIDGVVRLGPVIDSGLAGSGAAGIRLVGAAPYAPVTGDGGGIHVDNWSAGGPGGVLGRARAYGTGGVPAIVTPLAGKGTLPSPGVFNSTEPYPGGYHHLQTPLVCM